MTRTLYDSTSPWDIPSSAVMVGGYVDGLYTWTAAGWDRFPTAVKVRIAVWASTNDGHVLDVESGNATPAQAPGWARMRRAAGYDPSVYCSLDAWPALRAAFGSQGVPEPHWWIARWDNDPTIPDGAVACQYANPAITGAHYDLSAVADYWPGVDSPIPSDPKEVDMLLLDHGQGDLWLLSGSLYVNTGPSGPPGTNPNADQLHGAGVATAIITADLHTRLVSASTSAPDTDGGGGGAHGTVGGTISVSGTLTVT